MSKPYARLAIINESEDGVADSKIEWCDSVWNPIRGCSRVSSGCDACYAMGQAHRFSGAAVQDPSGDRGLDKPAGPFHGLTTIRRGKVDWTGHARFVPEMLAAPLRWRKPRRIFVNSMSDLFHESLSNEEIAAVFGVMAACPQHTFQVLTKRPKRAAEFFKALGDDPTGGIVCAAAQVLYPSDRGAHASFEHHAEPEDWPLPNVHLGVSAENQETYNARVPILAHQIPAAVRWVSLEPQLGPIKLYGTGHIHLNWVVQGGESGPGARPFEAEWARSMRDECAESGIPYFCKQLGANFEDPANGIAGAGAKVPTDIGITVTRLKDRKGGDMSEWPADLRVRQFPERP